MSNQLTYFH